MRIGRVFLKDFGPYEEAEIIFDQPMSIIWAQNHQGKSKLVQAIQLCLTKRSEGTDPRGAGADDKIRLGAPRAEVRVGVQGKAGVVEVTTTYTKSRRDQKIRAGNGDADGAKTAEAFSKYLDANNERLSCVLDSEYFVNQKPDTQKTILAGLVLPASHTFDAAMVALVEKHLGVFDWKKSPAQLIDQVYETAYRARTGAKAVLGGIVIPQTPQKPEYDAAAVQEKLADLRKKAAKEAKKKPAVSGAAMVARLEEQLAQKNDLLANRQAVLTQNRTRRDEAQKKLLDGPTLAEQRRIAAGRAMAQTINEKIHELETAVWTLREAIDVWEARRADSCCPTCTQIITPAFIDEQVAKLHEQIKDAQAQTVSLESEIRVLGCYAAAETKVKEHTENHSLLLEYTAAVTAGTDEIAELEKEIKAMLSNLQEARIADSAPVDTSELDALNSAIADWEKLLVPAAQYESTLESIEAITKRKEEQQATVNDLETLCREFGKDGIKASLIQEHINAFNKTVNDVLSAWGYRSSLSIEPYEFMVDGGKGWLPLKELSGSERMMFGVALQCAVASFAKSRMILVDAADVFIGEERGRLFAGVKKMLDTGILDDAKILLSHIGDKAPTQPGVGFYLLANGKVTRL